MIKLFRGFAISFGGIATMILASEAEGELLIEDDSVDEGDGGGGLS